MVDKLDRQILEVIANAPSLVRTVTRREIEAGVLFPSVTVMDIKRNLPENVPLNLVESRLNSLERDSFIFFNDGRWWLTPKGRREVGRPDEAQPDPEQARPMRMILSEAFTRHQGQEAGGGVDEAFAHISELYRDPRLTEEERAQKVKEAISALRQSGEAKEYLEARAESLSTEVEQLRAELAKKQAELEKVKRLIGE